MKLKPREPELPPSKLILDVPGKVLVGLQDYSKYYEASHGHSLATELMAVDMLEAFMSSDYDFTKWRRDRSGKASRKVSKSVRVDPRASAPVDRGEGR
jgi:hypothetical protein